jgi:hypothetical protein
MNGESSVKIDQNEKYKNGIHYIPGQDIFLHISVSGK